MQNLTQNIQCQKIELCLQEKRICLPFTSLIRDGVIVLNLTTSPENKVNIVKKELNIKPVKKEAVLGSNNSKSTANTLHKGKVMDDCILESERLAEKILSEFRLKEAQAKMPTPMVKVKNKPNINVELKETKELESKDTPKLTTSQSRTISLKEKYRNLNKSHNMKVLKRKLNNNSLTKSFLQLKYKLNFPIGNKSLQSNIRISDSSILDYLVSCRFCKQSFKTLKDCDNHSCENSKVLCNQLMYKCELCPLVFKYKNYLDRHMKGHNRNNCKFCNERFTKRKALCKHLKLVHDITEPEKLYNCSFCEKTFTKRMSLIMHLKNHAHGKLLCMKCGFMCTSEQEYSDHGKEHVKDTKYECKLCGKKFVRRQQHDQHMMGHEKHSCVMCDVTFSTKKMLLKHQQTIHGQTVLKKYQCGTCSKSFIRPIHLQIHERIHTGEKPVTCSHCEKSFSTERSLAKHLKTASHLQAVNDGKKVELEKPFLCSTCGATFFQQQSLLRHIEILHIPGNAQKCPHCDYNTKCKANMKRHIERHANIKRYVCEICGITFRALATLKEHALFVHSENRDFACDICQKGFKNKSGLQRHLRIHSELRPYKCHCSRDYKRLSHLKRHMAAAHCMTIRKSSDAKSLEICKIETNKGAAKSKSISQKISKADRNSTFTDEIISLNMPNTAFLSEELFETTFDKNIIVDPLSAGNVENNNGYIYVPTEGIENFIEKNNRDIAADIVSKSPLMPISQSTTVSITQDSVSLDDPELNLSHNYFAFNLSSSPLGPLENITSNLQLQNQNDTPSAQDNINRPRSLPNLSSHSSNVDSLLSFSLSNNELASTFLLDNDLPPSLDHNNPSKQLFGDSNDILSMSTFTTNGDSSILDCTSENFFNISRNSEIWDIPRDSEITSALDGEVASDSCDKISCMSNFPSNSPLPGNLVFNDSLLNYAIDANAFSAEDFAMT